MSQPEQVTEEELRQRVLVSMLLPAVRLARVFGMSLKDLRGWVDAAYFHELRAQGLTQREIAEALGVSERTAVSLSRKIREQFLQPEARHNLPRRIEFMLGAEHMGLGRLCQVLPELDPAQVEAAVVELLEQGRIEAVQGRTLKYAPSSPERRLPRDSWMDRIGGLNSFTENATNAVYGRFFEGGVRTFARTLTFRGAPGVFEKLEAFYEAQIRPGLRGMHVEDADTEETEAAQVSIVWAPYEYLKEKETEKES